MNSVLNDYRTVVRINWVDTCLCLKRVESIRSVMEQAGERLNRKIQTVLLGLPFSRRCVVIWGFVLSELNKQILSQILRPLYIFFFQPK